ncbi:K02A2.6-like, partial [Cordylochernes scorpioides]
MSTYIAELKKMAEYCNFGSTLDEAIRDRLIVGIEDDSIQRKLLGEGDSLTLNEAIEIALALEAAAQDAKDLQGERNPEVVKKIKQGEVSRELDRLVKSEILKHVRHAEWAAPIVPVLKSDQAIRICGDFKITANQALKVDQYPLHKAEDIFAALAGGDKFSKIDLRDAYNQLELDDESQLYTVINTHQGLYKYTRLPFGIYSAPALFQKQMDILLKGIPMVFCALDDILITGKNDQDHLKNLECVLQRIQEAGLKLRKDKCSFLAPSLEYLGHKIAKEGLQPLPSKIEAIQGAPNPTNLTELRVFLGLL